MCPRDLDDVDEPILGPLSLLPTAVVGTHGHLQLCEDIIVQWMDLECRLAAIRDILLYYAEMGTRPLEYKSCRLPSTYGYCKRFSTRKVVWKVVAQARDAFAILIGECHYLAIMNSRALRDDGRVHEGILSDMLISRGLNIHPA